MYQKNNLLYVVNNKANSISIINLNTNTIIADCPPSRPFIPPVPVL